MEGESGVSWRDRDYGSETTSSVVLTRALYPSALEDLIKRTPDLLGNGMSSSRSPNIQKSRRTRTFIRYATRRPTSKPRNLEGQEHLGIQIHLISPYHRSDKRYKPSLRESTRFDLSPRTRSSMRSDIHLETSKPRTPNLRPPMSATLRLFSRSRDPTSYLFRR